MGNDNLKHLTLQQLENALRYNQMVGHDESIDELDE
jgi:hypothetical protein